MKDKLVSMKKVLKVFDDMLPYTDGVKEKAFVTNIRETVADLDCESSPFVNVESEGLREQKLLNALKELYAIVNGECPSLLDEDRGGCAWLDMEIEDLLKCGPRHSNKTPLIKKINNDGKIRSEMATIVFHAAGRALTEEENIKIINMALEVTKNEQP